MVRRLIVVVAAVLAALAGVSFGRGVFAPSAPASRADAGAAMEHVAPPSAEISWGSLAPSELALASVFIAARDRGVGPALDSLEAVARRDASVRARGHGLAHELGRFVMAHNHADVSVLAQCRPIFEAGCYHGVLEGYLASVPSVDARALAAMCTALETKSSGVLPARECAHGLGHGLLERQQYAIATTLTSCDAFDAVAMRDECHDGAFMQNVVRGLGLPAGRGESAHHHGAMTMSSTGVGAFRARDLAFPCDSIAAQYQASCWSYQPIAIVRLVGSDVERTLRGCDLASAGDARTRCFAGLGKQSTGWFEDLAQVIDMCGRASAGQTDACLGGAVEGLVDANWTPDGAMAFCRRVSSAAKSGCYETVGFRMALVRSVLARARDDCAKAEAGFVAACVRGTTRAKTDESAGS